MSLNKIVTSVPYPSYSPEIASSDFDLCDTIKQRLCVCQGACLMNFEYDRKREVLRNIAGVENKVTGSSHRQLSVRSKSNLMICRIVF
jgi:hypothetical protein